MAAGEGGARLNPSPDDAVPPHSRERWQHLGEYPPAPAKPEPPPQGKDGEGQVLRAPPQPGAPQTFTRGEFLSRFFFLSISLLREHHRRHHLPKASSPFNLFYQ